MSKESDAFDVQAQLARGLIGHQLQEVEWREYDWLFSFTTGLQLRVACPWRIVRHGQIAFAEADDGRGLTVAVDGALESNKLLLGRAIEQVEIRADTADLAIIFDADTRLELWTNSGIYEPWELSDRKGVKVVAMGGGRLAIWGIPFAKEDAEPRRRGLHKD